jgi:hypothetical protein
MASWRDFAQRSDPPDAADAISAISAKSPTDAAPEAPNGTNGTNGTAALPAALAAGLPRLREMGVPRGVKPGPWAEVVADSLRLASEGWAYQALSLGWSALDLFGAITDPKGDPHGDGLAVWLSGRKVLALSAECAAVLNGKSGRSYFMRPSAPGARLLWELGRGR